MQLYKQPKQNYHIHLIEGNNNWLEGSNNLPHLNGMKILKKTLPKNTDSQFTNMQKSENPQTK